jgi:2-hydroxychromene-2-carboxylate isomerase
MSTSTSTKKRVEFFFDLSSPYSYLAATQIDAIAARAGAEITWRPMVLGAVFKAAANAIPASSPPKARYMLADLTRWAEEYGVPFQMTSRFPVNALKAMRLVIAAEREAAGRGRDLALAAFRALWVDDRDITDAAELHALAAAAGIDADRAVAAIENPEIKDALRANTDEALRRGAFGAPTFLVGDELFWGNDRLHFVERALKK